MKNVIYISNSQHKVDGILPIKKIIREIISYTLPFETDFKCEVSVTLVDDEKIREINLETRGKDSPTDVLSFPILNLSDSEHCDESALSNMNMESGAIILGDIVISLQRAAAQATEYNHTIEREVAFLTIHGLLHLLGYDHEISEKAEAKMFARQKKLLKGAGFER